MTKPAPITVEFDSPKPTRVQDGTDTKYSLFGTARQGEREYRINCYQYEDGSTAVTVYLNGRTLPENHKADIRAACLTAFLEAIEAAERPAEPPALEAAPIGQEKTIRQAFKAPAYASINRPDVTKLVSAYRYHRRNGRPAYHALVAARRDTATGVERYDSGPSGYGSSGKPFEAYGHRHMRWIENPAYAGLRFVGHADEICRSIGHKGWWLDPDGCGESVRGAVYQMAGRNGRPRFVAGYEDPYNGTAACLSFDEVFEGERTDSYEYASSHDAAIEAARSSDGIAERMAESERDYQRAWQAGNRYADLGNEIAADRTRALELFAERRAARQAGQDYPTICKVVESAILEIIESIQEKRAEREKLIRGNHDEYWFYEENRSAFADGAGLPNS